MRKLLQQHSLSFSHAFSGLSWAFSTQPNFRIHFALAFVAVFLGIFFKINRLEWSILLFTIVIGITGELMNTAVEAMTDLITKEWREEAKVAKDVAAGMMLFIALGSIGVALFIFTPYILSFIQYSL